jgi:hypothetical protein
VRGLSSVLAGVGPKKMQKAKPVGRDFTGCYQYLLHAEFFLWIMDFGS